MTKHDQAHVDALNDSNESLTASAVAPTSHTPGPWHVNDHCADEDCFYIEAAHFSVATIFVDLYDTDEANARLIAAAPELLAALKEIAALFSTWGKDDEARQKLPLLHAAIAKAEGR